MSENQIIRAFISKLIDQLGGYDATAALLSARFGKEVHKGTLSKRQSGELEWPLTHVWALENATGDRCISLYRAQEIPALEEGLSLMRGLSNMAKEGGEAMSAIADLAAGRGCVETARKELSEHISASKSVAAILNNRTE